MNESSVIKGPAASEHRPPYGTDQFRSPWVAAIFGFFCPGWGQWYNGRPWDGLAFFGATIILGILDIYRSVLFGRNSFIIFLIHLAGIAVLGYGMKNAFTTAEKINSGEVYFGSKSRLFWLPVIMIIALIAFLIVSPLIPGGSITSMGLPKGSSASVIWEPVIVLKPDQNHFVVKYQGGNDSQQVDFMSITVRDSKGSQTKTLGLAGSKIPMVAGDSVNFTGDYSGSFRVIVIGQFIDGHSQQILDYGA